jgi:hypothetical protein
MDRILAIPDLAGLASVKSTTNLAKPNLKKCTRDGNEADLEAE